MYSPHINGKNISFLVMLIFLLVAFVYQCNVRYDDTEQFVKAKIQNLTVDFTKQQEKVNQHFQTRMQRLKDEMTSAMDERDYYLGNLQSSYDWGKQYMNTSLYVVYSMYLPHNAGLNVLPPEINQDP
jgi:hypothetical protein